MQIFRAAVLIAWLVVMWVSIHAVATLGFNQGGATFFGDFSHPWRAQFNADFSAHLLLMAAWIVYRQKNLLLGLLFGLAAVMFGGAFSLAYIFVATFTAKGSFKGLLLGYRATQAN
jgi:hypothetical protein